MNPQTYLAARRQQVDRALEQLLPREEGAARTVAGAMRYAVFAGGKRIRPILLLAAAEACGSAGDELAAPASAVELIHTYSLIHDDLPAMDDDDLRRGKPTVHRAYGEATAVLAGDALHTLAFEVLASSGGDGPSDEQRLRAVLTLARAAGVQGMVGGQMADLEAEGRTIDPTALDWIHAHKTGALFAASAEIGAILAGADARRCRALSGFGGSLGLAFQIADDILDCTADAATLGKTPGKDRQAGKSTYPALFGLQASRDLARQRVAEALAGLEALALASPALQSLARWAVERVR